MRLIDADFMKQEMERVLNLQGARNIDVVKIKELPLFVDGIPTAYDVNEVAKQLEENKSDMIKAIEENAESEFSMIKIMDLKELFEKYTKEQIEIVKGGDINAGY